LRECGERTLELPDDGVPGVWEATQRVLDSVDLHGADTSVDSLLKSARAEDAAQARMLIEGFDAAITADTSMLSIAKEWRGDGNDTRFRPADGYGVLMHYLADAVNDRLWLNTPVNE